MFPSSHNNATNSFEADEREEEEEENDNLNEVNAPEPVQRDNASDRWQRNEKLESRHSRDTQSQRSAPPSRGASTTGRHTQHDTGRGESRISSHLEEEEENNLNELVGPEPVEDSDTSGEWRLNTSLEAARTRSSASQKSTPGADGLKPTATQVYIHAYLITFSLLGTLARLGMQWLTFYPGSVLVISNLWANCGGCVMMGFLSEDRKLFRQEWGKVKREGKKVDDPQKVKAQHSKVKKTIPFFIGLTTGFCGCLTSFSTFTRDVYLAMANSVATPRNHPGDAAELGATVGRNAGYGFMSLLSVWLITIGMTTVGLKFGAHIALASEPYLPSLRFRFVRRIQDPFVVFLAISCWVLVIVFAIVPPVAGAEVWRSQAVFALVFAPLGCLLRFYLALKLNGKIPWFPLGTFVANMFGVAVYATCYTLQHIPLMSGTVGGSVITCQVLQGLEDGFCGCLTTISTWAIELTTMEKRHAYFYGATSCLVALGLAIVIMGSAQWSVGFDGVVCVVETS